MALKFYADGKSWQEKMVDREKWQDMGANIGTGLGMGVRGALDAWTPLGKAYTKYLKSQEGNIGTLGDIKESFMTAVETGDASVRDVGSYGRQGNLTRGKEKFKMDEVSKWSDNTLNKVALEWAKTNAPEQYGELGKGEDYTYSPKDFRTLSRGDYKTSDVFKSSPEYIKREGKREKRKAWWDKVSDPNRMRDDSVSDNPALGGSAQDQLDQPHVIAQQEDTASQQGDKQPLYKNLLQMIASPFKGSDPNRFRSDAPIKYPESLSDIDITESDEYAKYRHGNYAIPNQYDVNNPEIWDNLLPGQQNRLLNLQPNEMEGVREYAKTPGIQGLLQRLFPGGKAGYYAGDYISQKDLLNQMDEAKKLKQITTMRNVYDYEPMKMGNE